MIVAQPDFECLVLLRQVIGPVLGGGNISLPGSLVCIRHCLNSIRCLRPSSLSLLTATTENSQTSSSRSILASVVIKNERGYRAVRRHLGSPARKHVMSNVWTTCPAQQSGTVLNINKRESGVGMKLVSRTSSRSSSSCKYGLNPVSRTNSVLSLSVLRS